LKFLLDTNVISELRKGRRAHPKVQEWANGVPARDLATSVLVLAEIRRGVEIKRLSDPAQAEQLDRWFETMRGRLEGRVLPVDAETAELWARLNVPNALPFVDGLLAATALRHRLILVTRNMRDVLRSGARLFDPFEA
jgi:toxin FitB